MVDRSPVIIEVAINGSIPKARNPHVPRTPEEIAREAIQCIEAGAAIVHNHNDDPILDMATPEHDAQPYIEAWRAVLAEHPDALLYPTMTGGGPHTSVERRYAHVPKLAEAGLLTLGLVDPGSINLGVIEADGSPSANETVYINSNADIRYMLDTCNGFGVPTSFSIFDGSFLRTAVAYARAGRVPQGGQLKLYFGPERAPFGFPPTEAALHAYLDVRGDCPLPWSVAILGGDLLASELAPLALERGGHLRVGLEDYAGPGQPTNLELLEAAVKLCESAGRPIASCADAQRLLRG